MQIDSPVASSTEPGWFAGLHRPAEPTSISANTCRASAERLAWLTGFTGSAGLAVVLPDKAAVFTDGRYVLQLAAQTDPDLWQRQHITEEPPHAWLAANAGTDARIGYDPLLISEEGLARYTGGRAFHGRGGSQSDRRGVDRPTATAHGGGRRTSAGLCRSRCG